MSNQVPVLRINAVAINNSSAQEQLSSSVLSSVLLRGEWKSWRCTGVETCE
jgi:hypothetical protein